MASYTVVNKSNAAIYWYEHFTGILGGWHWYSDDLPPGQSREVPSGTPSAKRGSPVNRGTLHVEGGPDIPMNLEPNYRNRPNENANVQILAKQGDGYIDWGRVWIHLGKTLEVYGEKDWGLK